MPFKSRAQRRKFHQLMRQGEISPETVAKWERETGERWLPERVMKKKAAYTLGQEEALVKLGLSTAGVLAARALAGGGLGAGTGALVAGEDNRLRGALYGAGLGMGAGALSHGVVSNARSLAQWMKFKRNASAQDLDALKNVVKSAPSTTEASRALQVDLGGRFNGVLSGLAGIGAGGALGGYLARPDEPEYPTYTPPATTAGLYRRRY